MTEEILDEKKEIEIGRVKLNEYLIEYFYNKERKVLRASLYLYDNNNRLGEALMLFDRNSRTLELIHINRLNNLLDIPELNGVPMDFLRELC